MSAYYDLTEAQIYVGTYKKYNSGRIEGKWLDLSDYSDIGEFWEACNELHEDEDEGNREFMFQDWENIPNDFISECSLSENFFELRDKIENWDSERQEAFFIFCNEFGYDFSSDNTDSLIERFEDSYQGAYNDEEDYAYEFIESCYNLDEFAKRYFDYEKFASDLFMSDYHYSDGYVFCRNF